VKNIELLVKPVSYACNLDCSYCFYKPVKELYPGITPKMEPAVLETLIKKALAYSAGGTAAFSWQGGEPLLAGREYFEKIFELQKKYGSAGQRVGNSVQTNGLLLDGPWLELFARYKTFLGISLDGDRETHEYFRKGSFEAVMKAVKLLQKTGTEFNVLTVVNSQNVKAPEKLFAFYKENGLRYVQLIPCAEVDGGGKLSAFSVGAKEYGKFLCAFFDLWYNDGEPELSVRYFDNLVELAAGLEPGYCGFKDNCGAYLVVEANGDVYPCDFFVQNKWLLGNINETGFEELLGKAKKEFAPLKSASTEKCRSCKWAFICKGGCLKYREIRRAAVTEENDLAAFASPDYFCEAYQMFYEYSFARLKKLAGRINARNLF